VSLIISWRIRRKYYPARESGAHGVLFDEKKTEGLKSRDTVPLKSIIISKYLAVEKSDMCGPSKLNHLNKILFIILIKLVKIRAEKKSFGFLPKFFKIYKGTTSFFV
jgi:hypothetical protein